MCVRMCVYVCASLFLSRSRLCAFLLQMSEPLLPTCCASVTKYWRRKIIQRFFKTFFNHFSSVRVRRCVSVCNGECSVCVCLCGTVDSFAGRAQTPGTASRRCNNYGQLFSVFLLFWGKRRQDFSFNRETARKRGGIRKRVEITLAIDAAVAAATAAFA